jgi:hypothetical protein
VESEKKLEKTNPGLMLLMGDEFAGTVGLTLQQFTA